MNIHELMLNNSVNNYNLIVNGPSTFQLNEAFYLFFAPYFLLSSIFVFILGIIIYHICKRELYTHSIRLEKFYKYISIFNWIYSLNSTQLNDLKMDLANKEDKNKYFISLFILIFNTSISLTILIIFCNSLIQNDNNMNVKVERILQSNNLIQ